MILLIISQISHSWYPQHIPSIPHDTSMVKAQLHHFLGKITNSLRSNSLQKPCFSVGFKHTWDHRTRLFTIWGHEFYAHDDIPNV